MNRQRIFVDCATCGTERVPLREADIDFNARPRTCRCPTCRTFQPLRVIWLRERGMGEARPKCGGACLNGKRSCDCRCGGRCHGRGECACGTAAPVIGAPGPVVT